MRRNNRSNFKLPNSVHSRDGHRSITKVLRKILIKVISSTGQSQGLLYKPLCHSLIKSVHEPFPPTVLWRRNAQTVRDSSSRYKIDYLIVIKNFLNPKRVSQSRQWFKSYSHFTEGVDFAYWWSYIRKGLSLQRAQQACF